MTIIKTPSIKSDRLPTQLLLESAKRLKQIKNELREIIDNTALGESCPLFSDELEELEESIIKELGRRQLE